MTSNDFLFVWWVIRFQTCILQTTGEHISLKVITSVTVYWQGNVKPFFILALIMNG